MARALDLDSAQAARVQAVLDSLRVEVAQAVREGPESLRSVALSGRRRLEEALPTDRRVRFQQWMQEHHARMMRRMGGGMMRDGAMAPGTTPVPDTPGGMTPARDSGRGMMGPGMMHRDGRGSGMMNRRNPGNRAP